MQSLTQQFIAFCRSKPADEEYDFWDCEHCAVYQFLGQSFGSISSQMYLRVSAATYEAAAYEPYTFGALTDRLEQSQPVREREPA